MFVYDASLYIKSLVKSVETITLHVTQLAFMITSLFFFLLLLLVFLYVDKS